MKQSEAMRVLEKNRARDFYLSEFQKDRASANRINNIISGDKKNVSLMKQNEMLRILDTVQARRSDTLVERRKRLAELLANELDEHNELLSHLTESDEQRRERLISKAKALREKRELEKKLDTERCNDRLFREKIDVLRQAESRLRVMQVADARFDQIAAARQKKEEEALDEEFFSQQAEEAYRLSCERSRRDLELIYQRNQQIRTDLAAQVKGNEMRRKMAKEQKEKEDEEFYRLLHEERLQEAQKQLTRKTRAKEIAKEMYNLQMELETARSNEFARLRKEDQEELERLLASICREKEEAWAAKQEKKEKEKAYHSEVLKDIERRKEKEISLDEMWKEANDKEWEKREKVWRADQAKRDALLHNILVVRRQQVYEKRAEEQSEKARERAAHQAFLDSLPPDDEVERKKRKNMEVKELQDYLDMQIGQRLMNKHQEQLETLNELSEQQAMEAKYKDKIAQELENLERAKPERYRNVPLLNPLNKRYYH